MARIALGHVDQGISAQARPCAAERRRRAHSARAPPDLLRQLRLAQLRPRLVDSADLAASVPANRGGGDDRSSWPARPSRVRRSPPSSPISIGRGAAASSGPTAGPGCSISISRRRAIAQAVGCGARAAGARVRPALPRLSRRPDLSDPGRHAFQHGLRAYPFAGMGRRLRRAARRRDPGPRSRLVRRRSRLPGMGAGRRRIPLAGADRGVVHGSRASARYFRSGSSSSCRALRRASRRPCSRPRSSATEATARSPTSTA